MKCYGNENNINIADSYNNLALLYKDEGDFDKTKLHYEKSLSIKMKCYGNENNIDIANSYNNLASLYKD